MGTHLPSSAYSTLGKKSEEKIPLCKLIVSINPDEAQSQFSVRSMANIVELGYSMFDVVDTEVAIEAVADFRKYVGRRFADMHTHVLFRVDLQPTALDYPSRRYIEGFIDRALSRMNLDRVSVSLTWPQDFEHDQRSLDLLEHALDLRREGKIHFFGLVDVPTTFLRTLFEQGLRVDYCLTAYSLLDRRPSHELVDLCRARDVRLLTSSSGGGGLLSERYLGIPEPTRLTSNAQQRFYDTILLWGGWNLFTELLFVLKSIAEKYSVSISTVALKWVLQQDGVSAAILDIPFSSQLPYEHNHRVFTFILDSEDYAGIESVTIRANNVT